jgi:hypothetical protein
VCVDGCSQAVVVVLRGGHLATAKVHGLGGGGGQEEGGGEGGRGHGDWKEGEDREGGQVGRP